MKLFSLSRALGAIALTALCFAAPVAKAVSFNFTYKEANLGVGPYGSVTLTQTGSDVYFKVELINADKFVKTGAGDGMYFKFNAAGVALSDIIVDTPLPTSTLKAATGAFNGSYSGNFAFGITSDLGNGAGAGITGNILFHVLSSQVDDFIGATAGTNPNYLFAIDVFSNGNTGPAAVPRDSNTVTTPDSGTTVMLLGASLALMGFARRFWRV